MSIPHTAKFNYSLTLTENDFFAGRVRSWILVFLFNHYRGSRYPYMSRI